MKNEKHSFMKFLKKILLISLIIINSLGCTSKYIELNEKDTEISALVNQVITDLEIRKVQKTSKLAY